MTKHIKIAPAEGLWVVRAGGAVLGETNAALELHEGDLPTVIYFPRDSIAMAFLEKSDHLSVCPYKGEATYYSIVTKSTVLENAAWSYEDPLPEVSVMKDYVAFYPSDTVTVEQI